MPSADQSSPKVRGSRAYCKGAGATNNVAEYNAAIDCLREIYKLGWRGDITLYGDSQLVARQYSGEYRCKAPLIIPLLAKLKEAATFFSRSKSCGFHANKTRKPTN
jgi:ribonuclease HI